ncbi:MAG: hypothetical protein A2284_18630 [Deltaproteobacteria bacterium RIFOXYA12_FULL_61_11]|nr:MAG: hypothetical protein A2284_18630 [Deltaproteobacteria bacterium RIFOXYA12_FULL_61_11]
MIRPSTARLLLVPALLLAGITLLGPFFLGRDLLTVVPLTMLERLQALEHHLIGGGGWPFDVPALAGVLCLQVFPRWPHAPFVLGMPLLLLLVYFGRKQVAALGRVPTTPLLFVSLALTTPGVLALFQQAGPESFSAVVFAALVLLCRSPFSPGRLVAALACLALASGLQPFAVVACAAILGLAGATTGRALALRTLGFVFLALTSLVVVVQQSSFLGDPHLTELFSQESGAWPTSGLSPGWYLLGPFLALWHTLGPGLVVLLLAGLWPERGRGLDLRVWRPLALWFATLLPFYALGLGSGHHAQALAVLLVPACMSYLDKPGVRYRRIAVAVLLVHAVLLLLALRPQGPPLLGVFPERRAREVLLGYLPSRQPGLDLSVDLEPLLRGFPSPGGGNIALLGCGPVDGLAVELLRYLLQRQAPPGLAIVHALDFSPDSGDIDLFASLPPGFATRALLVTPNWDWGAGAELRQRCREIVDGPGTSAEVPLVVESLGLGLEVITVSP